MLSIRRFTMTGLAALSAVAGCLALGGAPALAAPYLPSGSFGAEGPERVVVESSSGDLFVTDPGASKVIKLGPEGEVEGEITGLETPQTKFGLEPGRGVAVDNSESSSKGDVYIASYAEGVHEERPVVDKFAPKAGKPNEYEYVCELVGAGGGCHKEAAKEGVMPTSEFGGFGAFGVTVGATGDVYVTDFNSGGQIYEFGPEGEDVLSSPLSPTDEIPVGIAVDAAGDIYVAVYTGSLAAKEVIEINTKGETSVLDKAGSSDVAVNPTSGEVFVLDSVGGNHVTRYDSTGKEIEQFGGGEVGEANGIAYSAKNNDIYVTDKGKDLIHAFAAASAGGGPEVTCAPPKARTATSLTLSCYVEPKGEEATWWFEYKEAGTTEFTKSPGGTVPGTGGEATEVIGSLKPETTYVYRLRARRKISQQRCVSAAVAATGQSLRGVMR